MVAYLVALCFGLLLLIDRRGVLRSDAALDLLHRSVTVKVTAEASDKQGN
jgi:hypothetical protein